MSGVERKEQAARPAGIGARYLDGTYLGQNPDWHASDSPWKAEQVLRLLEEHRLTPHSVCDIGCGTGQVLVSLKPHLPPESRLVGYEPSPVAANAGPMPDGITIVHDDGTASDDRFDLLLLIDVMEHVEDCIGFLRALRHRADHTVLHIPLELSVQTVLRATPLLSSRSSVGHLHYFTRETAIATLEDAGYDVVDARLTRSGIDLTTLSWRQRAAAIPRRMLYSASPSLAARVLGGFSLLVLARARDAAAADPDTQVAHRTS